MEEDHYEIAGERNGKPVIKIKAHETQPDDFKQESDADGIYFETDRGNL